MPIELFHWNEAHNRIGSEWADLVVASNANPTQHPDWMKAVIASHNLERSCHVAVVRTAAGDTAIIPFVIRRVRIAGVSMRCLDLCSNVISYHAEILATGARERLLDEFLTSKALPGWDVFRLGNLTVGNSTDRAIELIASTRKFTYPGETSPYIEMAPSWEDYLRVLPKKMRANIKGCLRSMQQTGETGMEWYEHDSDSERLLQNILAIEARSWKAADNKAIQAGTPEGDYYQRLLPWLAKNGLMANVLYVNHQPTAYVLCAKWQGWVGQLKTSFVDGVRDAGFRTIQASIEHAYGLQQREYDFLGDAAPHKLRWTDRVRNHHDRWIFADHWRGRILAALKNSVDRLRKKSPTETTPSANQSRE